MQQFTVHKGLVAPMDRENVDTDAIIPKQFLKSIKKTGFGVNLFDEWRYLDHGEPGQDPASRKPNPDFVLNQPRYAGASILVARKNFGCGSSREHAVWGLQQFGIRAVIASSFGEIFYFNALNNGLLLVTLPPQEVDALLSKVSNTSAAGSNRVGIDVMAGQVRADGGWHANFDLPARHRQMFAQGQDMVGATLQQLPEVERFEARHWARFPWMKDVARQVRDRLDAA